MKVLHIYSSRGPGGAEIMMLSIARHLEKYGVENVLVCPKKSFIFNETKKLNLKVIPLRIRGSLDPLGIFGLFRIVKKEKPDILHIHQGKIFWPSIFVKWFCLNDFKLIFHRHADIRSSFFSRSHYKHADKIIAVSKKVAEGLIKHDKVNPKKITVVYNGVEIDDAKHCIEDVRKKYNLSGKIVIGTVGAINKPEGKGQKYLVDAAKALKEKYHNLYFLIVGDGTLRKELEDYSSQCGVGDIVAFTGFKDNVYDYIDAMDIFCLLSVGGEALPGVMIEAQLLKKPVIGTNVGGIPETFFNNKSGFLIPPRDVYSLKLSLTNLIENETKRRKMGEEGFLWAQEQFNVGKWCKNVISTYNSLA